MLTTQAQVRRSFWDCTQYDEAEEKRQKRTSREKDYRTDVRCAFVDYVDSLRRDEVISEALAFRVTL